MIAPPACGTYETVSRISSWAASDPDNPTLEEIVTSTSEFTIDRGPNGGPCPNGGFDPSFEAGTVTPIAGSFSPLIVKASRPDGSQTLKGLEVELPEGLTGKLAGIPSCSDAALTTANGRDGTDEQASPSCPSASQVGIVTVGAGAGSTPFHVQGKAYLAGPYKGAPLSVAVITPAVAGPFDLGTVVVRAAANVDPKTAQISVKSDPIPTILQGIPLHVRSVYVDTNRENFTLNPTSCDPMSVGGTLLGTSIAKLLSSRFQVGACGALGFKPRLNLRLFGGTKRGDYQRFRAVLKARPGDANIDRTGQDAALGLPRPGAIKTVCTSHPWRPQGTLNDLHA